MPSNLKWQKKLFHGKVFSIVYWHPTVFLKFSILKFVRLLYKTFQIKSIFDSLLLFECLLKLSDTQKNG